jgi:hypothetical protein
MTTSTGLTGIIPGRGIGRLDIVTNASGEYSRTPSSTGSETSPRWSCQRLESCQPATGNKIVTLLTRSG